MRQARKYVVLSRHREQVRALIKDLDACLTSHSSTKWTQEATCMSGIVSVRYVTG